MADSLLRVLLYCLLVTGLAACGDKAPSKTSAPPVATWVDLATATRVAAGAQSERTGTLRALRTVQIFNQEEGRIRALPFREGDVVTAGAVLVELDDALLKAQLAKARAERLQAEDDVKRLQALVKRGLVAEDQLSRARTALAVSRADEDLLQVRVGYTVIRAPFDGVISARLAEPGDIASPYTHLLTLIDPTSLITEVSVSELLLPEVSVGDRVAVRIDALGATEHDGRILRIHPSIDTTTQQATVEIALDPVPEGARAGQLCRIILTGKAVPRLLIPLPALQRDSIGEYVFTVDGDMHVSRKAVQSGLRIDAQVEILDGLEAGEQVVSRGFVNLHEGMQVQTAAPAGAPTDP